MSATSHDINFWTRSFNYANLLLLASIVLSLVATGWVFVSSGQVEKYKDAEIKREQQAASAKIAAANAEAAKANAEAAKANHGVADANAKMKVADVQISQANRGAAEANQQAQDAAAIAAEARLRQEELRQQNIQLSTRLNEAIADSNAKQTELAEAQTRLAEAQREQAKAQQLEADARLQLQQNLEVVSQKQQPRTLTAEQTSLLQQLLQQGQKGNVSITCVLGDAESVSFARELNNIIVSAGWTTDGVSQAVFAPPNPIGIIIKVHSQATAPAFAVELQKSLEAVNLTAPGVIDTTLPDEAIQVLVGIKP